MARVMPVRALLTDLDGVIRQWDRERYRRAEDECGLPPGSIRGAAFAPELHAPVTSGTITDERWRQLVVSRLAEEHPGGDAARAVAMWSASVGTVDTSVLALVRACRATAKVVLVSNATSRLTSDLKTLGILEDFDAVVNSSDVGAVKPHLDIYLRALATARVTPAEALMVDDVAANVQAAVALGMAGHVYEGVAGLEFCLRSHGLIPSSSVSG